MRIILKNFRQHASLEMEFQRTGLFMLQGPSGAGKTTIFDAIFEVLTGEADDVAPWGGTSCQVEVFDIQDSLPYIKRTRGPKTLLVRDDSGNEYKDEAAQAVINKAICMEAHDFLASSYIQQEMSGSLLKLPPAEQLRFVQKLGAGTLDPEIEREKIQAQVRHREQTANLAKMNCDRLLPYAIRAEADLKAAEFIEPVAPMSQEKMDEKYNDYLEAEKSLKKAEHAAAAARANLRNPLYEQIRNLDSLRKSNEAVSADSSKELDALTAEELALTSKSDFNIVIQANSRKASLAAKRKRLEIIDKMKELAAKVTEKYGQMSGNVLGYLDDRLAEVKRLREIASRDMIAAIAKRKDLENMSDPQHCPACSVPLLVESGKIVSAPNVRPHDYDKSWRLALQEAIDAERRIADLSKEAVYIQDLQSKAAYLKSSLNEDTAPECKTIAEVDAAVLAQNELISNQRIIESEISKVSARKDSIIRKISSIAKIISETEAKIAATDLTPEADVKNTVYDTEKLVNTRGEVVQSYQKILQDRTDYLAAVTKRNLKASHYATLAGICQRAREDYTSALNDSISAEDKLAASRRLKELSDQAAVMAIELNIEKINENAKVFIDRMFPDDGTSVRIKNTTETKSGDAKPKLSVEIFHKGKVAKKLSNLSGGERSRITLAFQLALGEMYKSPILLVDEGFSGLAEEQVKQCLELLKEAASDRLILAIEHGAPESLFDGVFRLDSTDLYDKS